MNTRPWRLFLIAGLTGLLARVSSGADLLIELQNPPSAGIIEIQLFDSPDTFGELRSPVRTVRIPAAGQTTCRITGIPSGEYALMVYLDENSNGSLDKNFLGIPREPVGFANGYQPKGPPAYPRARLTVSEGTAQTIPVELNRPLGERGRLGAGLGAIVRSSPYRGAGGGTFFPIPAVTYTGDRLQIFGPRAQFGLTEYGPLRLAAVAQFRPGAYKENDSSALDGMGNRKSTVMAGASMKLELPSGLEASLTFLHDAPDRIGGSEISLSLDRSIRAGILRLTPGAGINWTSARLANHDYGVSSSRAAPGRPAYDTGDTLSFETGIRALAELTGDWWFAASLTVEFLPGDATGSPVVSDPYLLKGFLAVQYMF